MLLEAPLDVLLPVVLVPGTPLDVELLLVGVEPVEPPLLPEGEPLLLVPEEDGGDVDPVGEAPEVEPGVEDVTGPVELLPELVVFPGTWLLDGLPVDIAELLEELPLLGVELDELGDDGLELVEGPAVEVRDEVPLGTDVGEVLDCDGDIELDDVCVKVRLSLGGLLSALVPVDADVEAVLVDSTPVDVLDIGVVNVRLSLGGLVSLLEPDEGVVEAVLVDVCPVDEPDEDDPKVRLSLGTLLLSVDSGGAVPEALLVDGILVDLLDEVCVNVRLSLGGLVSELDPVDVEVGLLLAGALLDVLVEGVLKVRLSLGAVVSGFDWVGVVTGILLVGEVLPEDPGAVAEEEEFELDEGPEV